MDVVDGLKYTPLVSFPLFLAVAYALILTVEGFSLAKHTISVTILNVSSPLLSLIFRINFVVKALLDLGFTLYFFTHYSGIRSVVSVVLLAASSIMFGALSYYTVGKYSVIHSVLVYSAVILAAIGQFVFIFLVNNPFFTLLTVLLILTPVILTFRSFIKKNTNAYIQITGLSLWYVWWTILLVGYLK